jgi:hypothetical protein
MAMAVCPIRAMSDGAGLLGIFCFACDSRNYLATIEFIRESLNSILESTYTAPAI